MSKDDFFTTLPSDPNMLHLVDEFLETVANSYNIPEDIVFNIHLCLSEAVTNAMVHANKRNPEKHVFLSVSRYNDKVLFVIKDEGTGFNPSDIPDPTIPENLLKDHGRGLYLMRIYTTKLEYINTPAGTEAHLEFKV